MDESLKSNIRSILYFRKLEESSNPKSENMLALLEADLIYKLRSNSDTADSFFAENNEVVNTTEHLKKQKIKTDVINNGKNENATYKSENEADVGIICALSEERKPFFDNFNDDELEKITRGEIQYQKGVIITKNGKLIRFVTVIQQEMGTVDAAAIGAMLVKEFMVKHLFMIGVCGGREEVKVKIGDIIIPTDSVAYQRGKLTEKGLELAVGHSQTNVSSKMIFDDCRSIIDKIFEQYMNKRIKEKKGGLSVQNPSIHYEPMACGENVVDKANELNKISEDVAQRKLCAIDMESYAILRLNKFLNIKTVVIKSVMDLANNKSDEYKEYAAYVSANFLYEILKEEVYEINS